MPRSEPEDVNERGCAQRLRRIADIACYCKSGRIEREQGDQREACVRNAFKWRYSESKPTQSWWREWSDGCDTNLKAVMQM